VIQLFRFSAVSWNSHRIHYDGEFARSEGHGGVVVQSTLHGEMLVRYALEWAGPGSEFLTVSWRNAATALAEAPLVWTGTVREVADAGEGWRVTLDTSVSGEDGIVYASGTVVLVQPR
jgi:hydroxyacyl-ACP dehydratase HTD2-like protein with hotdog domain